MEVARAGTAGRGLAVVTEEIRTPASKFSEASKNTLARSESYSRSLEKGVKIADETEHSL